jgi:predicted MFS family arabinose efflux permease
MDRKLLWTMSIGAGVSVANLYYIQPLLATIAQGFHISTSAAGSLSTITQAGYAIGMLLLVPLGDAVEKRKLILIMLALVGCSLLAMAGAPGLRWLMAASLLIGITTVTPQLIVPFAAQLAAEHERGKVVGTVMSGLLLGILLARTVAGALANLGSWRTIYWVGCAAMVVSAAVLSRALPRLQQSLGLSYLVLMRSIITLFREEPVLRLRAVLGASVFGAFAVLWTSVSFLLAAPPYGYSAGTIGLFGLAGMAGAMAASGAGRLGDRGHGDHATGWGLVILLLSWGVLAFAPWSLTAMVAGILLLDLAVQGVHISNQSALYRIRPEARNRLTAGYMTCYFIGGAVCSLASAWAYTVAGWAGVTAVGAAVSALGLASWGAAWRLGVPLK